MNILGISGSLRAASYNTAALRAAQELAPKGVTIEIAEISEIPLYNDDEKVKDIPASVTALQAKIKNADAVLVATPEYNYSVPGVLKNAIDWLSRTEQQPFAGKPLAIIGASPGVIGTARAQYDLRKIFVCLDARVMNKPEVMIGSAHTKFDASGKLTDEDTRKFLSKTIVALQDWTLKLAFSAKA
jgi:chromate reductase